MVCKSDGGAIAEARFKDLTLEELSAPAASAALPRSSPEAQGVSSAGIRAFVEAADRQVIAMHSFMLVRHGRVVAEGWWKPEAADKPHVAALFEQELHFHRGGARRGGREVERG